MVDLIFGLVVLKNPSHLVYLFVWENASSDDQLVKGTKVSKHLAIVIHFTKTVLSHNCLKTCTVDPHLGVEISKQ